LADAAYEVYDKYATLDGFLENGPEYSRISYDELVPWHHQEWLLWPQEYASQYDGCVRLAVENVARRRRHHG